MREIGVLASLQLNTQQFIFQKPKKHTLPFIQLAKVCTKVAREQSMPKPNFTCHSLTQLIAPKNEKNILEHPHIGVRVMLTHVFYYTIWQSDKLALPYIIGKLSCANPQLVVQPFTHSSHQESLYSVKNHRHNFKRKSLDKTPLKKKKT